jgi:O-antigen/teichoic acid export membrane protein
MTAGRLLARNVMYNLAGQLIPLAAAFVAIPFLLAGLGPERFGILTLAWTAIGYFSLFDLGLTRAVTHAVATKLGAEESEELGSVSWTAIGLMLALGSVGAAVLAALSPVLVYRVLQIPHALQSESLHAFYLIALALPWMVSTGGFRGLLEAHQDFGVATALRIPLAAFTFIGPLAVLPFSHGLGAVIGVLVAGRLLTWLAHVVVCLRRYPFLRGRVSTSRAIAVPLLRFGGWTTVSNVVSPLMVQLDRFLIGALLAMTAVAYYVTPYEMVIKLLVIPQALLGVLFPAIAASYLRDRSLAASLFERGTRVVALTVFPIVLAIVVFAHEGLGLWLGGAFATHSAPVLQWLAIGVFVVCLGQTSFFVLQGVGRPDVTAKLHLVELPMYAFALWWLAHRFGLVGVAFAWTARAAFDSCALLVLAGRQLPEARGELAKSLRIVLVQSVLLASGVAVQGVTARWTFLLIALPTFVWFAWTRAIQPEERAALARWIRRGSPAGEAIQSS